MKNLNLIWGLLLVLVITAIAFLIGHSEVMMTLNISTLTLAIVIGILCGNTFYPKVEHVTHLGVAFAKGKLLRLGIILYGFRITLQDIGQVGVNAVVADAIMLILTFIITCWIGIKILKVDKQIVFLTGAGCSICGAAAIIASEPVVRAPSYKVSVAVALIVIFGTIAMFLYPILYPILIDYMNPHQFGIYIGSSVHEVAQVYAAGSNINPVVADIAVVSKMIRVMMLAPFLLVLSYFLHKDEKQNHAISIPYFALIFILVAVFNSFNLLPTEWVALLVQIDTILLMAAMAGLGLTTNLSTIKQAGLKPLLLGLFVFIWLVVGGFGINLLLYHLLG
ncbi:YeiH family protein [Rodentibacter caecimuris]|uniref:YeiH family protein n=1 Tax=Rodentibacter caecimuris TaxID=1796644 RepID=UPI0022492250|nr:YeiH family protein [Rodentibacter heylii]MCX2962434.1 YeiH family protein [Rodentibacter heylii]